MKRSLPRVDLHTVSAIRPKPSHDHSRTPAVVSIDKTRPTVRELKAFDEQLERVHARAIKTLFEIRELTRK